MSARHQPARGRRVALVAGGRLDRVPPTALALGSVLSIQVGHALAKALFPLAGPSAVVAMRLGFAAAVLLLLWRPRLPTDRRTLGLVAALGIAVAGMNAFIYLAMAVLPLGVAVTIAFLGPLTARVCRLGRGRAGSSDLGQGVGNCGAASPVAVR